VTPHFYRSVSRRGLHVLFLIGTLVYGRTWPLLLVGFLLAGCESNQAPEPRPSQPAQTTDAIEFDKATASELAGQVVWGGAVPQVAPYRSPPNPLSEPSPQRGLRDWPNPCAPAVDPSGGVGRAVVFLRGVDPRRAKPWDLPPVRVDLAQYEIRVHQGDAVGRCGFVRRGDSVDFVSNQAVFHSLQGRGAAYFALPFPAINVVSRRPLEHAGIVELSSGAGYYWMRAYLHVLDNPYATLTDGQGHFTLSQVPPGRYQLVVWHPNWQEAAHARDADTCQVCRLALQPPLEVVRPINIGPSERLSVTITLRAASAR